MKRGPEHTVSGTGPATPRSEADRGAVDIDSAIMPELDFSYLFSPDGSAELILFDGQRP